MNVQAPYTGSRGPSAPSIRAQSRSPTSFARSPDVPAQSNLSIGGRPHGMLAQAHSHSMPQIPTSYRSSHGQIQPISAPSPPESHIREHDISQASSVPSYAELESHYRQLHHERRRLEEMLERTDELITGVKRGMEQIRSVHSSPKAQPNVEEPMVHHADSVRLPVAEGSKEATATREPVWSIENDSSL